MATKQQWILIRTMVFGTFLIATAPVHASEYADGQSQTPASDHIVAENVSVASPLESHPKVRPSDKPELAFNKVIVSDLKLNLASEQPAFSEDINLEDADLTVRLVDSSTINGLTQLPNRATTFPDGATKSVELANRVTKPADETAESIEESPEATSDEINLENTESPEATSDEINLESTETSSSPRWRFTFEPYVYIPLHIEGEIGIDNFETRFGEENDLNDIDRTIDIDTTASEIIDTLRDSSFFGFMGRTEAWRNRLGIIFDASYLSLQQSNTTSLNVPDRLKNENPSEIEVDTHFSYGQFDLGVGYRLADSRNLTEAATDFDLGPIVFDVVGGLRLYTISSGIDIDTNRGRDRRLDQNTTFVTPLLSSRLRWNLSRNLALSVRGDVAGFGIQGLDLAWSATTGLDWMFWGDTSLFLGYRVSSIDYSGESGDRDLDIDLLLHGPYVGMVFRF